MQFMNPMTDFAFNKIFGGADSHDILLSFLNAVLDFKSPYRIKEVRIEEECLAPPIKGVKENFVDVRVVDEQGRHFIIEMQVLPVANFEQRVLYNACKKYAGQISSGEDYRLLNDVIVLTITDFIMFEHTGMVSKFRLRDETDYEYSDDVELIFVELPKFTKTEAELENMLDKWVYFLRFAKRLNSIPSKLSQEKPIEHAFAIANRAQLTPQELEAQERREMYIQDQRGVVEYAVETSMAKGFAQGVAEGLKQGIAQGIKKAIEQGKRAERIELAKNLKNMGMDEATIAKAIGISLAEVNELLS